MGFHGFRVSVWADEKVLEVGAGDGVHLEMVNFLLHVLYYCYRHLGSVPEAARWLAIPGGPVKSPRCLLPPRAPGALTQPVAASWHRQNRAPCC